MSREQLVGYKLDVFGASVVLENDDVLISQGLTDLAKLVVRPLAGLDFRLGSKADLSVGPLNVRFRLGSRH